MAFNQNQQAKRQLLVEHYTHPVHYQAKILPNQLNWYYAPTTSISCADHFEVALKIVNGTIEATAFSGQGCVIATASLDLLLTELQGLSVLQASQALVAFHHHLKGESEPPAHYQLSSKFKAVYDGLNLPPTRHKCALLGTTSLTVILNNYKIAQAKTAYRAKLKAQLKTQNLLEASQAVISKIETLPMWKASTAVGFYAALNHELDLSALLKTALATKAIVALPRVEADHQLSFRQIKTANDLERDRFGILAPKSTCPIIPINQLNLIFVPGLGFNQQKFRLGHGHGYYDRLLTQYWGLKIGVATDAQIVADLPVANHDQPVNLIVTPTKIYQ